MLPHVVERIARAKSVFLFSTSSQTRNHAASVIRQCLHAVSHYSPILKNHQPLLAAVKKLTALLFESAESVEDEAAHASVCKTIMALWALPNGTALDDAAERFVRFSAGALDIKRAEIDDLLSTANGTWTSIAFCKMKKSVLNSLMMNLCDFLGDKKYNYGRSNWTKTVFLRALRILVYNNLHRVGRFVVIESCVDAAVMSLECQDNRVRSEAMLLLAVLTKVATEEQVQYIVQAHSKLITASDAPYASVATLCGILQADPDAVPRYVPKLLTKLAPFARRNNSEVATVVKRLFLEWWRTHRDRWELEHKRQFTESQMDLLEDLFKSPSYYV